jgi:tRNA-binding EMAP/Myf-like protein
MELFAAAAAAEAEMQNRRVVCVTNLKPAAMRGIVSQAMVLAATHPETGKVSMYVCSRKNQEERLMVASVG